MSKLTPSIVAVVLGLAANACDKPAPKAPDAAVSGETAPVADAVDPDAAPIEVKLCDDKTTTAVPAGAKTREDGQRISDTLMDQWRKKNPDVDWEAEERLSRTFVAPADNKAVLAEADGQGAGHSYRAWTQRDLLIWQRDTETWVAAGSKVFHSGDDLGSTIAVSCDMCHPNAANTHPETYPKFQTQIGRVVLLRDMINWCLEHPVRAPRMAEDDARMRAMEAYIISQRSGTKLEYGKH